MTKNTETKPCYGDTVNVKYSKSAEFYIKTKQNYFENNNDLFNKAMRQNEIYSHQPIRVKCKICSSMLPDKFDFRQHGIEYFFCSECGHLNGRYEDSKTFVEKIYMEDGGVDYSEEYVSGNYNQRMIDIYMPKVNFLLDNLPIGKYKLLDIGCGGGHFVYALMQRGVDAYGIDIGKTVIDFGNAQILKLSNKKPLSNSDENGFYDEIRRTDADIVSAIGVIEHLREPNKLFEAFRKGNAGYLYYSVPMFSLSVIVENVFSRVFPRQLSADHTHLFTEKSLRKMNLLAGVRPVAEWRFGTDIMDLYRSIMVTIRENGGSKTLMEYLGNGFGNKIDDLQSELDKNHFCSEIHCLTKR